jgi:hypothetical protein
MTNETSQGSDGDKQRRMDAWLATLTSTCPHCQTARAYADREQLHEGSRSRIALLGDTLGMSNLNVHVYQCTYCGSIELFRDGDPVEHPLAGNRDVAS